MKNAPISILVIDSDSASRDYLRSLLNKDGYAVLSASLGEEGLRKAWEDRPDIIIFDPVLADLTGLDLVTRLQQDGRTSEVPCIVLSSGDDAQERIALLAAGCNEYLVKSSQAPQKLLGILPRFANMARTLAQRGKLIVFSSAKGGTGTSSLCANVAACLANSRTDEGIAVLDLVLPIGSIAHIVGYEGQLNLVTVAAQSPDQTSAEYFKENLPRIPVWHFYLLAGAPDPDLANQLPAERVGDILEAVLESYAFVFVDLGRSLSRISIPIIRQADVIVLVLGTDYATASLTQTVRQYIQAQGVDMKHIYTIQNRAVGLEGLTKAELEKMVGLPISVTMPYMGDNLTVANNRHVPMIAWSPHDTFSMLLNQTADQIVTVRGQGDR